jgi:hypothetical protein
MSEVPKNELWTLLEQVRDHLRHRPLERLSAEDLDQLRQSVIEFAAKYKIPDSTRDGILWTIEASASAPPPTPEEREAWAKLIAYDEFAKRLANRQGNKPMDFETFYRQRNSFNRKVFSDDDAVN